MKEEIPVFKCPACGLCCTFSPVSILPHEDVVLKIIAGVLDLPYKSQPGYTVYDEISGLNIAFSYIMELNNGRCVFLSGVRCLIHNVYKPLICRSYPYVPRHVKYNIDERGRYILATADYGISLACPIVRMDRSVLEKYSENPGLVIRYMKREYEAAVEMENARNLLLGLLSKLWREGLVELSTGKRNTPVVNLYEFLRKYYPDLPNMLNIDKVVEKIKLLEREEK
ncbi:putative Fe-S oxidoreductase [Desulfurococcus amylolyticus DSM 16532]|uniref:Putative Fe-S oxidoreductase n=2 Tax=Desulfurococcus amylolyticus TaxID=94694 RepID=I3XRS1_DESAM|nr:putative Fe-S oxidoreductase [Desulfurococcus amylolyticus DSM 16532]